MRNEQRYLVNVGSEPGRVGTALKVRRHQAIQISTKSGLPRGTFTLVAKPHHIRRRKEKNVGQW